MNHAKVVEYFGKLMTEGLGLDLSDPNLTDTPDRVARMYINEFFAGLDESLSPKITVFPNTEEYDEMILMDNVPFVSMCSHHFLPFSGLAWFLYIPDENKEGDLSGASKIPRLINYYAARPQLQENLTQQILTHFISIVKPRGAMLVMRAVHGCMSCRGVKTGNQTGMVTSKVSGIFKNNPSTKAEALSLINLSVQVK